MKKTQVYFPEQDLIRLHYVSKQTNKSVASLIREAVQDKWLQPVCNGPVALWKKRIPRTSMEHDSIYDQP